MTEHLDKRDPAGRIEPGTLVANRYQIMKPIAAGGMGYIYYGIDQQRDALGVAVKLMRSALLSDESSVKRFFREAQTLQELEHPNIVRVYDYGKDESDLLYIAMEWLEGLDLSHIVTTRGPLPPDRAAHFVSESARALAGAHDRGIIHRDLKPENILLHRDPDTGEETIKVLDFGVVKMINQPAQTQLTQMGTICGTPEYMSPEQALGRDLDGRSDLYALGCVLYTLLTGEEPFQGAIPINLVMQHLNAPFPKLPASVPPGLADIVYKATQKKPDKRYAHISELAEALEDFVVVNEVSQSISHELANLHSLADDATRLEVPMWVTPATGTPKLVLPDEGEEPTRQTPLATPKVQRPDNSHQRAITTSDLKAVDPDARKRLLIIAAVVLIALGVILGLTL